MTLEAGKEMDKRCVLNWLNEVYVTPSRAFNEYTDDELKTFAHDALALLNEQEELLHKKEKDIDKLCVEISRLKHQIYDNEPTFDDWTKGEGR